MYLLYNVLLHNLEQPLVAVLEQLDLHTQYSAGLARYSLHHLAECGVVHLQRQVRPHLQVSILAFIDFTELLTRST